MIPIPLPVVQTSGVRGKMRLSRTFYYNGLVGDGFDTVVNPVITQPVIQYTLYLKVKYEVEQPKAK